MTVRHVILHPEDELRDSAAQDRPSLRCRHPPLMLLCWVEQFTGVDVGYGDGVVPLRCITRKLTVKSWTVPAAATHGRFITATIKAARAAVPAVDAHVGTGHAYRPLTEMMF